MCDKYNGWKNYETWNVKLWLDNDEGTYRSVLEIVEDANREPGKVADDLEYFVLELAPELPPSMFSDILGAALRSVDWYEIAEAYCTEDI